MTPEHLRRRGALALALLAATPLAACGVDAKTVGPAANTAAVVASASATPASTSATTTASSAAGGCSDSTASSVSLRRPFSSTSPWNTPAQTQPVDARSSAWIARASRRVVVVDAAGQGVRTTERRVRDLRLYVNTCAWTPEIVGTSGGQVVRVVCRQRNCGPVAAAVKTLHVPAGAAPLPQFDGWFSVVDEAAGVAYDMWRARRAGNVISYQLIKRWPLAGPGFSAPATDDSLAAVGARGSGLPLFAGVIQPDELRRGRIEHALAISVPGPAQRIFVSPASVTDGVNGVDSLPEGSRLRLKSGYASRISGSVVNRRAAEAIVTALRTYGAIVVDRSITPTLYARRGDYGSLLQGTDLRGIRLSDFEVVKSGTLLRFPPLDTTREAVQG